MAFDTFDDWADWIVDGNFDTEVEQASDAGDRTRVVELFDSAWDQFPGDAESDDRLQGFVYTAMGAFLDVSAWDAAERWLPRFERHYGADDPTTRFYRGVIAWEQGRRDAGQRILAELHEEFGASAFGRDDSYVSVATGQTVTGPGTKTADSPEVQALVAALTDAMDAERWDEAIGLAQKAVALVGRRDDAAMWFLAHQGDAEIELGRWAEARDTFHEATQAPGGIENPYIQLRLGECEFELGNERPAANGLIAAYMQVPDILDGEPARYREFLQQQGLI